MTKYNIYVGLNDSTLHKQLYSTEEYINTLKNICRFYHAPFSFEVIQGGYIYDDGNYTEETALHITLFNQTEEIVNEIANDLCTFFSQESVLVTQEEVKMYYVKGENEVQEIVKETHKKQD